MSLCWKLILLFACGSLTQIACESLNQCACGSLNQTASDSLNQTALGSLKPTFAVSSLNSKIAVGSLNPITFTSNIRFLCVIFACLFISWRISTLHLRVLFRNPFVIRNNLVSYYYLLLSQVVFIGNNIRKPFTGAVREANEEESLSKALLGPVKAFFAAHGISIAHSIIFASSLFSAIVAGQKVARKRSVKYISLLISSIVSMILVLVLALNLKIETSEVEQIVEVITESATPKPKTIAELFAAKLSSRAEILEAAKTINMSLPPTDEFIENAVKHRQVRLAHAALDFYPDDFLDAWYSETPHWMEFKHLRKNVVLVVKDEDCGTGESSIEASDRERYLDGDLRTSELSYSSATKGDLKKKKKHYTKQKYVRDEVDTSDLDEDEGELAALREKRRERRQNKQIVLKPSAPTEEESSGELDYVTEVLENRLKTILAPGDAVRESSLFDLIKNLVTQIVGVLFSVGIAKSNNKPITSSDISSGLSIARSLGGVTNDLEKCLIEAKILQDPNAARNAEIAGYEAECIAISSTPAYKFAVDHTLVPKTRDRLAYISTAMKTGGAELTTLRSLHLAANSSFTSVMKNSMSTFVRQEPFVVLLIGPGGVGKTKFAQGLMEHCTTDIISNGVYDRDVITLTTGNKYWPMLSGQRIALFDEALSAKDLKEDLLMNNLRSICSSAHFNAEGASVEGKINPLNFEIIFATSNCTPENLVSMIATHSNREAIMPYLRRMIVVEVTHRDHKRGTKWDPNQPHTYNKQFTHLVLNTMQYSLTTEKLERTKLISIANLKEEIARRYLKLHSEFLTHIQRQTAIKESVNNHFSLCMHGPGGNGKTPTSLELASSLSSQFLMPIVHVTEKNIKEKQERRCIAIVDDYFGAATSPERESLYMDFYNQNLQPGSIIINCSNVTPKMGFPTLNGPLPIRTRKHPFKSIGLSRRMGYCGHMQDGPLPVYNLEYYVTSEKFSEFKTNISLWHFVWLIPLLYGGYYYPLYTPICFILLLFYISMPAYCEPLNRVQIKDQVFSKYLNFLKASRTVPFIYDQQIPDVEYDMILISDLAASVQMNASFSNVVNNVFYTRELFNNSTKNWRFFLDRKLYNIFCNHSQLFSLNIDRLGRDEIITLVHSFAHNFASLGTNVSFKISVGDVGDFALVDNKLYICERATTETRFVPRSDDLLCRFGMGTPDLYEIAVPYQSISSFENFVLDNNLTAWRAAEIGSYIRSNAFVTHKNYADYLIKLAEDERRRNLEVSRLAAIQQVRDFMNTGWGTLLKVVVGFLSFAALIYTISKIYSHLNKKDIKEGPSGKKKKIPRVRYDSDEDVKKNFEPEGPSGKKKKVPKPRLGSDDERPPRQYVGAFKSSDKPHLRTLKIVGKEVGNSGFKCESHRTLVDMNDFDPYNSVVHASHSAAIKNQGMIFMCTDTSDSIDYQPTGHQAVYATLLDERTILTVGHIVPHMQKEGKNIYFSSDETKAKGIECRKLRLLKSMLDRDLSVWTFSDVKYRAPVKNITKHFIEQQKLKTNPVMSVFLQRWNPGKKECWNGGDLSVMASPIDWFSDGVIHQSGEVFFGTFGNKFTTFGDCGLPYFAADSLVADKIVGIHFGGNSVGYTTIGIIACVSREDVESWVQLHSQQISCCLHATKEMKILPSDKPKVGGHENVWNSEHESTSQSFLDELHYYLQGKPNFRGIVLKNSGSLYGSVEHSHTQFLPGLVFSEPLTNGFVKAKFSDHFESSHVPSDTDVLVCCKIIAPKMESLKNSLSKLHGNDFRIQLGIQTKMEKGGKTRLVYKLLAMTLAGPTRQIGNIVHHPIGDQAVYVDEETQEFLTVYQDKLASGKLPCIPFNTVEDNQTVQIVGFCPNMSKVKTENKIHPTRYSSAVEELIPNEKAPFSDNMSKCPPDQFAKLAEDSYGKKSARVTQSLMWAHPVANPDSYLVRYVSDQFYSKILQVYSNLTLLTDEEVLSGIPPPHRLSSGLQGLQLNKSVGPTMRSMFNCTKKNDIIGLTDEGHYFWHKNEAATWAKNMYHECCKLQDAGLPYYNAFLEMVKVEKLKNEKQFLGRIFCAQDLVGVLLERRVLGTFCAEAMLSDRNCGIGKNDVTDFHMHYRYLSKNPNYFTGDYKRWDKTVPMVAWNELTRLLCKANPRMAKQLRSTMYTLSHRLHFSGNTLFFVNGGMASGCVVTAVMNSLINDWITYYCFVKLSREIGYDSTYFTYDAEISRIFTGDDLAASVPDSAKFLNRVSMSRVVGSDLLMTLDSSQKDGTQAEFESYEVGSWISRFFRRLGDYPIYIGALKKESIGAFFHWTSDTSVSHCASLLMRAQYEAAMWEPEYFEKITKALHLAIQKQPALSKTPMFAIRSRESILAEIYEDCITSGAMRNSLGSSICFNRNSLVVCTQSSFKMSFVSKLNILFQQGKISRPLYSITLCQSTMQWTCLASSFRMLDDKEFTSSGYGNAKNSAKENAAKQLYAQIIDFSEPESDAESSPIPAREIGKEVSELELNTLCSRFERQPFYSGAEKEMNSSTYNHSVNRFQSFIDDGRVILVSVHFSQKPYVLFNHCSTRWHCKVMFVRQSDSKLYDVSGTAETREAAKQVALKNACAKFDNLVRRPFARGAQREMDVAASLEGAITGGQLTSVDPTQTPQAGIMSNTTVPSVLRDFNPSAIALNNVGATGAPFNRHQFAYNIFTDVKEWDFNMNGSLAKGAELTRISLDPVHLPSLKRDYVNMHHSWIPELEVAFRFAGAAGTISFVRIGWVKDITKTSYTLEELQSVSSIDINLNEYQSSKFLLRDIRKRDMYRSTQPDENAEPYPGIVFMVLQPSTNVQRNDDVNYPCQFQVRLGPGCILMEGFRPLNIEPSGGDIDLSQYFPVAGQKIITDGAAPEIVSFKNPYPTHSYGKAHPFIPLLARSNLSGYRTLPRAALSTRAVGTELSNTQKEACALSLGDSQFCDIFHFTYGPGNYQEHVTYPDELTTPIGTVYSIPKLTYTLGVFSYACNIVYVCPESVTYVFKLVNDMCVGKITNPDADCSVVHIDSIQDPQLTTGTTTVGIDGDTVHTVTAHMTNMEPSLEAYMPPSNYISTYVRTGNNFPFSNLPTGMALFQFSAAGTTASVGGPSNTLLLGDLSGLMNRLKGRSEAVGAKYLKMNLSGTSVEGEIAYGNDVLMVRTNDKYMTQLYEPDSKLTDIVRLDSLQAINSFNTVAYNSWVEGSKQLKSRPRFPGAVREMMAAAAVGGLANGIAGAIQYQQNQNFTREMINLQNQAQLKNIAAQGIQQRKLNEQQQEYMIQRMGYGSSIAQQGRLETFAHQTGMQQNLLKHQEDMQGDNHSQQTVTQLRNLTHAATQNDLDRQNRLDVQQAKGENAIALGKNSSASSLANVQEKGLQDRKLSCLNFEHRLAEGDIARSNLSFRPSGIMTELYPQHSPQPNATLPSDGISFNPQGQAVQSKTTALNPDAAPFVMGTHPPPVRDRLTTPVNNY